MRNPLHAFVNHPKSNKNSNRDIRKIINKELNDIKEKTLTSPLTEDITKIKYGERYAAEIEKRRTRALFCYEKVSKIVAGRYNVDTDLIPTKTRKRDIVDSRQEICFIMYLSKSGYSQYEIGRHLGGRDHSTVNHSCMRVIDRIETMLDYREGIVSIFLELDPEFDFEGKKLGYLLSI